tara:strand:+ start:2011 stop:2442 length:432 start_codon:yes stop_codon:yes gene_type:complete
MLASIDFKRKSRKLETKFQMFMIKIQSRLDLKQRDQDFDVLEVFDKGFKIRKSLFGYIERLSSPCFTKPRVKIKIVLPTLISSNRIIIGCNEVLDWTQGRLNGPVVRLVISNGVIIEKILQSPKGRLIIINSLQLRIIQTFKG